MSKEAEEIKKATEAQKQQNSEQQKSVDYAQESLRITRDINSEAKSLLKNLKGEGDLRSSTLSSLREANKAAELQVDLVEKGKKALLDTKSLLKSQESFEKSIAKLKLNQSDLEKKRLNAQINLKRDMANMSQEEIQDAREQIRLAQATEKALKEQIQNQVQNKKITDSLVAASKQIADLGSIKLFSSLSAIANAIPGVKSLTSGFDAAAVASKEAAASMVKIGKDGTAQALTGLQKFQAGLKGLSAGVGELMKSFGMIAIIGKLVQGMMKADKSTSAIAQGLNISGKEAAKVSKEIIKIKAGSDEVFVSYDGLKHSLLEINKELGTSGMLNKDTLKTFTTLNKRAGLTEEALMGMTKLSFATGGNLEDMTGEFLAQSKITAKNQKVALNEKQLFGEISKLSAATTLSLGKNPAQLAKAVATAKALGMEMSNLENIAGSLLDFESSIEKELEAELLLGKNINLEKARQAALNNDLATVAEEIAAQAGSAADFAKMNRLQQEALADAVGMGREELAQTLFVQEQLKGATEEEAQLRENKILELQKQGLSNEQIKDQLAKTSIEDLKSQASQQAEMAAATERMNETFMELGKNLQPILEGLSKMAEFASRNVELLIAGVAVYKTMAAAQKLSIALKALEGRKETSLLGKAVARLGIDAAKSAAAVPVIGAVLALAAGAAAFAFGKSLIGKGESAAPKDDVMFPGQGNSGYGNRMISAPEGTFALNNKDTIIAGTNLDQGRGGSASSAKLEELQAQTNTLLTRLLNKDASIRMDSEELGTAISLNNYEVSA